MFHKHFHTDRSCWTVCVTLRHIQLSYCNKTLAADLTITLADAKFEILKPHTKSGTGLTLRATVTIVHGLRAKLRTD